MEILATGLSHRTAPVAVRERAAVPDAEARTVLRWLVGHSGLSAAAVLSTCNRTEFYLVAPEPDLADQVVPRLARYLDPGGDGDLAGHLVSLRGAEAVRHMFRVAAGLDSMVVGEAQILGQFKAAHRTARSVGTLDPRLDFVMRRAVSVAKRVRTETAIGRSTGSVAELALDHARRTLGSLAGAGVLLIGAGKVSTLAARRLAAAGARLSVVSRGGESAIRLAEESGGRALTAAELDTAMVDVDVVIASTSSAQPVVAAQDVRRWQAARGGRPLFLVDIAVPRDVDPDAGLVDGVTLVDLDTLGEAVDRNLERRRAELPAAEAIVEVELDPTMTVIGERDAAAPTIGALTRRAEAIRRREVERAAARLGGLDDPVRQQVEALTRSLVRKLLHAPIAHLKESADDPSAALLIREAFDLDEGEPRRR